MRWPTRIAVAALVAAVAAWVVVRFAGDDVAWAVPFALGPRWLVVPPVAAAWVLAAVARRRRAVVVASAAMVVAVGPVLGLCVAVPGGVPDARLRVMTWNAGGQRLDAASLGAVLAAERPDVLCVQEADRDRPAALAAGWNVAEGPSGLRLVSPWPVRLWEGISDAELGANGGAALFALELPTGPLTVANVHLPTPRPGLEAAIGSRLADLSELRDVLTVRNRASKVAADWAAGTAVIAGDFNMTDDGPVYRRDWGHRTNAFAAAGIGFGRTKRTRWFGTRIDHVLAGRISDSGGGWRPVAARVGPDLGSDHLPLIVDLVPEN